MSHDESLKRTLEDRRNERLEACDPLKEMCDFMRENNIIFVFWTCPKGCQGRVEWNDEKTDATCQVCGCKKSDNAEVSEAADKKR